MAVHPNIANCRRVRPRTRLKTFMLLYQTANRLNFNFLREDGETACAHGHRPVASLVLMLSGN